MMQVADTERNRVAAIVENPHLAASVLRALACARASSIAEVVSGETAWDVFQASLNAAIRDIGTHARGNLLRRLLIHGPLPYWEPGTPSGDEVTTLSDPESGLCVDFIYSHMINRFKGELAELLAIEAVLHLVSMQIESGRLPVGAHLYWGPIIEERRRGALSAADEVPRWLGYGKGADGLVIEKVRSGHRKLRILAIAEVKSMACSIPRVLIQIDRHSRRLTGGLRLRGVEWPPEDIEPVSPDVMRIVVQPSEWKLSRQWERTETGLRLAAYAEPSVSNHVRQIELDNWSIILAWSAESLEAAAFAMTFWYMGEAGRYLRDHDTLPDYVSQMTPEDAGQNLIKQALYFLTMRHLKKRQRQRALQLYNAYCFGYPASKDADGLLAPEDFG